MPSSRVGDYQVFYENSEEFHHLKREIFSQHIYYLEEDPRPLRIIDAGAHIGLSTLYFKQIWPQAEILAVEPNPHSQKLLQKNIEVNQLTQVKILPYALDTHTGTTQLQIDSSGEQWFSSSSLHAQAWNGAGETTAIEVPAQPLSELLKQPVGLLKMDIEGAEGAVLQAASGELRQIQHLILEYHPREDNPWTKIEDVLRANKFKWSWLEHQQIIEHPRPKRLALLQATSQN